MTKVPKTYIGKMAACLTSGVGKTKNLQIKD
jgi:hypothetical protein